MCFLYKFSLLTIRLSFFSCDQMVVNDKRSNFFSFLTLKNYSISAKNVSRYQHAYTWRTHYPTFSCCYKGAKLKISKMSGGKGKQLSVGFDFK